MKRTLVEHFFADFGHPIPIEDVMESTLLRPRPGEAVYTAEVQRMAGQVARGLFFIRIRDTAEKLAAIRADTVVLGATTMKAIDFWRPLSKGRKKPVNNWVADIVEVPYAEIVALRYRRSGLTLTEMQATKYW
jgi:hypothetical protein